MGRRAPTVSPGPGPAPSRAPQARVLRRPRRLAWARGSSPAPRASLPPRPASKPLSSAPTEMPLPLVNVGPAPDLTSGRRRSRPAAAAERDMERQVRARPAARVVPAARAGPDPGVSPAQVLLSEPDEAAALYRGLSRQPALSAACLGPEVTTQYGGRYRTVHTGVWGGGLESGAEGAARGVRWGAAPGGVASGLRAAARPQAGCREQCWFFSKMLSARALEA